MTFSQSTCVQDVQDQRPHSLDGKEIETKRATPKSVSRIYFYICNEKQVNKLLQYNSHRKFDFKDLIL